LEWFTAPHEFRERNTAHRHDHGCGHGIPCHNSGDSCRHGFRLESRDKFKLAAVYGKCFAKRDSIAHTGAQLDFADERGNRSSNWTRHRADLEWKWFVALHGCRVEW
jgi:hypothetical protein